METAECADVRNVIRRHLRPGIPQIPGRNIKPQGQECDSECIEMGIGWEVIEWPGKVLEKS